MPYPFTNRFSWGALPVGIMMIRSITRKMCQAFLKDKYGLAWKYLTEIFYSSADMGDQPAIRSSKNYLAGHTFYGMRNKVSFLFWLVVILKNVHRFAEMLLDGQS